MEKIFLVCLMYSVFAFFNTFVLFQINENNYRQSKSYNVKRRYSKRKRIFLLISPFAIFYCIFRTIQIFYGEIKENIIKLLND